MATKIEKLLESYQGNASIEEWRSIATYEGKYEISNFGMVRRITSRGLPLVPPITLKQYPDKDGYMRVALYPLVGCKNQPRTLRVSTLVIDTFNGPNPGGLEIRHLNGIRSDNNATNLKWGTHSENILDKVTHGTDSRGEKSPRAKMTREDVLHLRQLESTGQLNKKGTAREMGISATAIYLAVTGKNWGWLQ